MNFWESYFFSFHPPTFQPTYLCSYQPTNQPPTSLATQWSSSSHSKGERYPWNATREMAAPRPTNYSPLLLLRLRLPMSPYQNQTMLAGSKGQALHHVQFLSLKKDRVKEREKERENEREQHEIFKDSAFVWHAQLEFSTKMADQPRIGTSTCTTSTYGGLSFSCFFSLKFGMKERQSCPVKGPWRWRHPVFFSSLVRCAITPYFKVKISKLMTSY